MKETLRIFCEKNDRKDLLGQWNKERNEGITPDDVSYGSRKKVWWQCEKGHEWESRIYTRTAGSGCPCCCGKTVNAGENDLASVYPELAKQWHTVRNGDISPEQVSPGSHRTVWWQCEKGHEWRAAVKTRTAGNGCPVCGNRRVCEGENDLKTLFPQLAGEWNYDKNNGLEPSQIMPFSRRKVWWICEKGHEWKTGVALRASGSGCPVCSGKKIVPGENDFASGFPEIAAQWHTEKNKPLKPDMVARSSNKRVWWICENGHEWQAQISRRTQMKTGCPYCTGRKVMPGFNDLKTLEPEIAAQWDEGLNGSLTPEMVTCGSRKKVWWRCSEGHVWTAVVYSRTGEKKSGCPVCAGRYKSDKKQKYYSSILSEKKREGSAAAKSL